MMNEHGESNRDEALKYDEWRDYFRRAKETAMQSEYHVQPNEDESAMQNCWNKICKVSKRDHVISKSDVLEIWKKLTGHEVGDDKPMEFNDT